MRALGVSCALWLAGAAGCDGPVLRAGTYLRELDGSAASDASDDARVASNDAGRARDAQQTDAEGRFPWDPAAHPCNTSRQCFDNAKDVVCHPRWGVCVECLEDRDCEFSGRCNEEQGRCREPEKPRP